MSRNNIARQAAVPLTPLGALAAGAAAGAAGTSALNAIAYLDMAWRARPASTTPETTVQKVVDLAGIAIPGSEDERGNRLAGLGPLLGIMAGTGLGAALGLARAAGYRPGLLGTFLTATAGALVVGNGPMTALGVTDPRTWSRTDWASDILPHLAYGITAATALLAMDPAARPRS
ncbi:hypothetical protein [Arthrobacter sp. ZGTC131]|uniref:hypothetical protein n=1 Tax=Arthrobacter sp. ZGTC131 TaxID=2058898 RepID=UPI000CE442D1|nr:hypothetical protein [Arthrobacter sp. ZGTC131]